MSHIDRTRRIALRSLLLGAAGAAVAACGGKSPAPAPSAATPADAPPPAPPAAAPAAPAVDTSAAAPPAAAPSIAGTLPSVDPKDPQAVSLGYVADASALDPAKNPPYQPGRRCATCVQFKGAADAPEGPCTIFVGRAVKAAGWCKVWAPKPA